MSSRDQTAKVSSTKNYKTRATELGKYYNSIRGSAVVDPQRDDNHNNYFLISSIEPKNKRENPLGELQANVSAIRMDDRCWQLLSAFKQLRTSGSFVMANECHCRLPERHQDQDQNPVIEQREHHHLYPLLPSSSMTLNSSQLGFILPITIPLQLLSLFNTNQIVCQMH